VVSEFGTISGDLFLSALFAHLLVIFYLVNLLKECYKNYEQQSLMSRFKIKHLLLEIAKIS
jgi:hypothetical protein